jgi:prevent-host-death family protein
MTTREARARFADVVHAAAVEGRTTYITSNGRRVAAVVSLRLTEAAEHQGTRETGPEAL